MKRSRFLASLVVASSLSSSAIAMGTHDPDTLKVALLPDEDAATVIQDNKPLAAYLEKLARYAYRISDEDFEAAKAERGTTEFIYELTLLGCFAASSVGVEELYEHLDLGI